eukprot:775207_1
MTDHGVYEVEAIIQDAFDTSTNGRLYYVKWINYDDAENTWQTKDSIQHLNLFKIYEAKRLGHTDQDYVPPRVPLILSNTNTKHKPSTTKRKAKTKNSNTNGGTCTRTQAKKKKRKSKKKKKKKHKKRRKKKLKRAKIIGSSDDGDPFDLCTRELINCNHDTLIDTDTSDDEPIIRSTQPQTSTKTRTNGLLLIPKKSKKPSIWRIPKITDPLEQFQPVHVRKKRKISISNPTIPYTKPMPQTVPILPANGPPSIPTSHALPSRGSMPISTPDSTPDSNDDTDDIIPTQQIPIPNPNRLPHVDPSIATKPAQTATIEPIIDDKASVKNEEIVGPTHAVFVDLTIDSDDSVAIHDDIKTNKANIDRNAHAVTTPIVAIDKAVMDTNNTNPLRNTSTTNITAPPANGNVNTHPVVTLHASSLIHAPSMTNHNKSYTSMHPDRQRHIQNDRRRPRYHRDYPRHRMDRNEHYHSRRSYHTSSRDSHPSRRDFSRMRSRHSRRRDRIRRSRSRSLSSSRSRSRSRSKRRHTPPVPTHNHKQRPKRGIKIVNTMKTGRQIQQMFADPWDKPHAHVVDHPIDVDLTTDTPFNPSSSTFITSSSTFPTAQKSISNPRSPVVVPTPAPARPNTLIVHSKKKTKKERNTTCGLPLPMPTDRPKFKNKFQSFPPNGLYLTTAEMVSIPANGLSNWLDPTLL